MIITVTNQLAVEINKPEVGEDGVALPGGNHPEEATHRSNPLPYPAGPYVGTLDANGGANDAVDIAMNPRDWRYSRSQMRGLPVSEQWNQIVQAGVVTFAIAAQTDVRDVEELYVAAV